MLRRKRGAPRPPQTTFVGRDREIADLGAAIGEEGAFVTLRGPAGVGKTRLSLELATRIDGAVFVDLSEVEDATGVLVAVARALELPVHGAASLADIDVAVTRELVRAGQMLLVLDNFEQILDASAHLAAWRERAPHLRLLVTSRAPLDRPGERIFDLSPLELPARDERDAARIAAGAAVRLFADRARASGGTVDPSGGDAEALARIVRLLDGIPLAIELCAARAGLLGLKQIGDLLERDVLSAGRHARESSPRQATLRGALAWSWRLLDEPARLALARTSVFRGGFTPTAARAVVDLGAGPPLDEVLEHLHSVSLLTRRGDVPAEEPRYGLYESVREFAAERLADDRVEASRAAERHARYFAEEGTTWAREADRRGGPEIRRRLTAETENLQASWRFWRDRRGDLEDAPVLALRALLALEPIVGLRGPLDPYAAALDDALAASEEGADPVVARAHLARARLDVSRGRLAEGRVAMARVVDLAQRVGHREVEALARSKVGALVALVGEGQGDAEFECAKALTRELDDPWLSAIVDGDWGSAASADGRGKMSIALRERAVEEFRRLGDRGRFSILSGYLGASLMSRGRYDEARRLCDEALLELSALGDQRAAGHVTGFLGRSLFGLGDIPAAIATLDEAVLAERSFGDAWYEGVFAGWRADVSFARGELEAALRGYATANSLLDGVSEKGYRAIFLAASAVVEAQLASGDAGLRGAEAHLVEAEELARTASPPASAAVAVYAGLYAVMRARRAPSVSMALADVARARSSLGAADALGAEGEALIAVSEDVRFAQRLLVRELGEQPILFVAPEARWVQREGHPLVEFPRQRALRLVLLGLVEAHQRAPGEPVRREDLIAAGWPGEKIRPEAAQNRLHVTLSRLKALAGLRDVVRAADAGVMLAPKLPVWTIRG